MSSYDLLREPLLGVEDHEGRRTKVTLPGLLERLSQGIPTSLTAVQAYQQHPVHAFLVQLAALCLSRAEETEIARDEASWRALLLAAAKEDGAGEEAFTLVVGDLAKPAFLQSPVPEGTLDVLKSEHRRPSSELDVLITSKNHDVKIDRIEQPSIEHWIFALLTVQTMQGFLGAGNYGIARMNGGFSSRPCVAYAVDQGATSRFKRDVRALLQARPKLLKRGFGERGHLGLVWCAPWNGATSLGLTDLDPFFIEICRRVRLGLGEDGRIVAYRGSSKAARIDAKDSNGNTGDPWTPVAEDGKALTMPESGFHYERVHGLLFGDWEHGAAGKADPQGQDRLWVGQVLVRGQGKTGGYHERWLPVPQKARLLLAEPDGRQRLGERSLEWVRLADEARRSILKPALLTLLQGAPDNLKFDDNRVKPFLARFDAAIDDVFFPLLFQHVDSDPKLADTAFQRALFEMAEAELKNAEKSLPVPTSRRWRAEAHAQRVFHGAARNHFKLAFPPPTQDSSDKPPATGATP